MPLFETNRLRSREFNNNDATFILTLLNNPSWLQFIGDRNVKSLEDAQNYLLNGPMKSYYENGFGLSLIELKENKIPIGMCGLIKRDTLEHVDIGFALLSEYAGMGYAFEIASATMVYAKNSLRIDHIVAITSLDNMRSINLLNKLGLSFERMVRLADGEEELMLFSQNVTTADK